MILHYYSYAILLFLSIDPRPGTILSTSRMCTCHRNSQVPKQFQTILNNPQFDGKDVVTWLLKMAAVRKFGNIVPAKTVFFCCDMQERFRLAIQHFKDIVVCADRLVRADQNVMGYCIRFRDYNFLSLVFATTKYIFPSTEPPVQRFVLQCIAQF